MWAKKNVTENGTLSDMEEEDRFLRGFLQAYGAAAQAATLALHEPRFFDWSVMLPRDDLERQRRCCGAWQQLFKSSREALVHELRATIQENLDVWVTKQLLGESSPWKLVAYLGGGSTGTVFLGVRGDEVAAVKIVANNPLEDHVPPTQEVLMALRFANVGAGPDLKQELDSLQGFTPYIVREKDVDRLMMGPHCKRRRKALPSFLGWYAMAVVDNVLGDETDDLTPARGVVVARALASLLTRCTEEKLVHGDAHLFNVGFRGVEDAIFLDFGRSCSVEDFLRRREELATAGFGDVEACLCLGHTADFMLLWGALCKASARAFADGRSGAALGALACARQLWQSRMVWLSAQKSTSILEELAILGPLQDISFEGLQVKLKRAKKLSNDVRDGYLACLAVVFRRPLVGLDLSYDVIRN